MQSEAPALQKTAINPHFKNKYVSLDSLMPQILPLLNKHKIVLVQSPTTVDGEPALRTLLVHAPSGDRFEDTMKLILEKANSQGQGSAITYARRYALMAVLGLVADVDDDAQAASKGPSVAAMKREVYAQAQDALDKAEPTLAEVAKHFDVEVEDLQKAATLKKILGR